MGDPRVVTAGDQPRSYLRVFVFFWQISCLLAVADPEVNVTLLSFLQLDAMSKYPLGLSRAEQGGVRGVHALVPPGPPAALRP